MNFAPKRIAALLTALVLTMGNYPLKAAARETVPSDPYVFQYAASDASGHTLISASAAEDADKNTDAFLVQEMPSRYGVTLEITGYQQGGDVYVFESADTENGSALLGYDDGITPVNAQITAMPAGILKEAIPEDTLPEIQMDISAIGRNSDSFAVGEPHTWIIRGEIPDEIGIVRQYTVTETLDHRLSYEKNSLTVSLHTKEGTEFPLEMETHYALTEGTVLEEEKPTDRLSVALTPAGMAYVAENLGKGGADPELRISFRAAINTAATMGTQIIGSAQLSYTDPSGTHHTAVSDKPAIYTGGLHILLTDSGNAPLQGGAFMIARPASEAEIADLTIAKELLDTGKENIAVIYEEFYSSPDMRGEKTACVTTGEDGSAILYGLAYGRYYLVQTETAEGRRLPRYPLTVEINEVSHLTKADGWHDSSGSTADNTIRIINEGVSIPATGGQGTAALRASGAVIILSACLLLFLNRRRGYK